jgi:hypothetical protein
VLGIVHVSESMEVQMRSLPRVGLAAFSIKSRKAGSRMALPVMAVLLVLGIALGSVVSTAESAHAAGCYGSTCNYKDPQAMGCNDPITLTEFTTLQGSSRVELRYSATCGAAWARLTVGPFGYVGYSYVMIAAWYSTTSTSSLAAAATAVAPTGLAPGTQKWSPMYQFSPYWVSACLSDVNWAPSGPCTARR